MTASERWYELVDRANMRHQISGADALEVIGLGTDEVEAEVFAAMASTVRASDDFPTLMVAAWKAGVSVGYEAGLEAGLDARPATDARLLAEIERLHAIVSGRTGRS